MRGIFALLVWGASGFVGATAEAAYVFTFAQESYDLQPGQVYQVPVYIQETITTNLDDPGLVGAGVVLQQAAPLGNPVATFSATSVQAGIQFAMANILAASDPEAAGSWTQNPTAVKLAEFAADPVIASSGRIQIGWVGFTAGTSLGSTIFEAIQDAESSDNVLGDWITSISVDAGSVTINVVPEAATVGLVVGASPLMLWRRRIR